MKVKLSHDWYGQRQAREILVREFGNEFGVLPEVLYQRLAPHKPIKGSGGAQAQIRLCTSRSKATDWLIKWNLRDKRDLVLAARSVVYAKHDGGNGGYEGYLGVISSTVPPRFPEQQSLL